jgi:hypothetical protein
MSVVKKPFGRYSQAALVVAAVVMLGYFVLHSRAAALVGDLNSDGTVNILDLSVLLSAWGTSNSAIESNLGRPGPVDVFDLSILLSHWGQSNGGTTVNIDGTSGGKVFDGIGAISGGGGNSRYIPDYPAAQQAQIMNLLFKPGYGASLQILKVEIGGDTNSTDGAEASIEHTKASINCNAGYEWQMMQQAKALNPNIKLYALAWGAPGWPSGHTFTSNDTITYLVNWMNCAKQKGLSIDNIGGQNEKPWDDTWYKNFRTALNNAGYAGTKIVAADTFSGSGAASASAFNVANDIAADPALKNAIGIVGAHDVCGYPTDGLQCWSTATAQGLGLPLWISEAGHMDGNTGADKIARSFNRGYQDAKLTGYIQWPLLNAMPPGLSHEVYGLVTADEPWSGYFTANHQIWAYAHTTQFTAPGWHYVDAGTGFLGGNRANGSYVTYKSPNNTDWSMVAETSTATSAQVVNANILGGLNSGTVHVWATNLNSTDPADWFKQLSDITPTGGAFSYTLQPGYLYSFTTTTGQSKGATGAVPAAHSFALPYSDTFASMDSSNEAKYFATMSGAFEGAPCAGGVSGTCLQQNTPTDPIDWGSAATPYTVIGDNTWTDYTVSSSVLFKNAGSTAGVIGRFGHQGGNSSNYNGYLLQVNDAGTWNIYKNNNGGSPTSLVSGSVGALGTNSWHTLALKLQGATLTATINGQQVGTTTDASYTFGPAGLDAGAFTNTWPVVQYRNFSVSGTNALGFAGPVYAGLIDKCLDNFQGAATNGNKIELFACNYSDAQRWNVLPDGTLRTIQGKCMEVAGSGTAGVSMIDINTCNGGANQQWQALNGTLVSGATGKCLDDPGSTTTNGTQLDIKACDGSVGQYWTLPQ